jgi:ATP-binding cassette, subfamily B, bacterial PglK
MIPHLLRFWRLLDRSDRWRVIVTFLFVVVCAFLDMLGVALLPIMVAVLNSPELMVKKFDTYTKWHLLDGVEPTHLILVVSSFVGLFFLFKNVFAMWSIYRQGVFKSHLQCKIGRELLHGFLQAPYAWHLMHHSGDIQQTLQKEVSNLTILIISQVFIFVTEALVLIMVVVLLMCVSPAVTLISGTLVLTTTLLYTRYFRVKLQAIGQVQREKSVGLFRCVQQSLGGIKELKVLGRTGFFEKQYVNLSQDVARGGEFMSMVGTNVKFVLEMLAVTSLSLVVIILVALQHQLQAILPSLALFSFAAIRLMPSANRMVSSHTTLGYGKGGFILLMNEIEEIRSFKDGSAEPAGSSSVPWSFNRDIVISNVSFRYPLASKDSLTNVQMTIQRGQSVAFVGESGAGKTTLVDLVLGLLEPTSGTIMVDGKNIHDFLATWQQHLGYIPQNIYISEDCVRMNVAFGIPPEQINDKQVWAALEAAQLAELVRSWPEQLDRHIGERGVRLSGGQRQRIGIARAFYHNPAILVLDEATAALDNETEREIVSVMERFRGDKTLLTIAHRLTTVRHCDKLFYMNDGQVVASGTYEQLEKECPAFQRMVQAAAAHGNVLVE